jgi:DnaJ family protein C protein 13
MLQPSHGPRVSLLLQRLLPPGQVDALQEGPPEAALRCLDRVVETPECLWDLQMAAAAAAEVSTLAAAARKQQVRPAAPAACLPRPRPTGPR